MGAQTYLIALDLIPETNDKIIAGFLFAPGGFLGRSPNPLRLLAQFGTINENNYLEPVFKGRVDQIQRFDQFFASSRIALCSPTAIRCSACDSIIFALFGFDAPQMNYVSYLNIPLHIV